MKENIAETRPVLAVLASREDSRALLGILGRSGYSLGCVSTWREAETLLRPSPPMGVVICGSGLSDGHRWLDVLAATQRMPMPPKVIVVDRLADGALWAEVLNLGCYDLLMTPFEPQEVRRVVSMAWDSWKRDSERAAARRKAAKAAKPSVQPSHRVLTAGGSSY